MKWNLRMDGVWPSRPQQYELARRLKMFRCWNEGCCCARGRAHSAEFRCQLRFSDSNLNVFHAKKSGVALRLPPQSETQTISENQKPLPVLPEGACGSKLN
jgi:hypothetical protein